MDVFINRLGMLLKAYRHYHKLSQNELAKRIDIPVYTIVRWEATAGDGCRVRTANARKLERIGIVGGDK